MNKIKGNKLIAEFMGGKFHKAGHANHSFHTAPKGMPIIAPKDFFVEGELKYHESWAWLMPVVEKIDELCPPINGLEGLKELLEPFMGVVALPLSTSITEAWQAVVDFIKWHNKQTDDHP